MKKNWKQRQQKPEKELSICDAKFQQFCQLIVGFFEIYAKHRDQKKKQKSEANF